MIDRSLYKGSFDKNKMNNNWRCPRCNAGILCFHENKIFNEQDANTLDWERKDPDTFDWITHSSYVYTTILVCSNKECNEKVICSGSSCVDIYDSTEDNEGNIDNLYQTYYKPLFFYPPINIFDIPRDTPLKIKKTIIESFSLYFTNNFAATNQIRLALEMMMTELGVEATKENGSFETLHNRIKNLDERYSVIKDKCLAIKWLGNSGSHGDNNMTSDNVLDGYDLLSFVLDTLYISKSNHVDEITKRLIDNKGI